MKFKIIHEIKGRLRIHMAYRRISPEAADILQHYLLNQPCVSAVKVYERNQDAAICYIGKREDIILILQRFSFQMVSASEYVWRNSGRQLNRRYKEKIIQKVILRMGSKLFLPAPLRDVFIVCKSMKYICKGTCTLWKRKIEVSVLDGTAIAVSLLRGNIGTAGSVMFLLGIGEVLEEWTHKKSVNDLARSMSLNIGRVWVLTDGKEILADADEIRKGDSVVVRMGSVIPFDGVVIGGTGEVNQAALTGEALPVSRESGGFVYAGTALEVGELVIRVTETSGSNKYEKIVRMIEESERLKSSAESRAAHLADRLAPYTLLGAGVVYMLTRNAQNALSVLVVDFSCALKLAMPIAVLSAIREAGMHRITVKGGRFLEKVAEADTIILDKTGTITRAHPTIAKIVPFNSRSQEELLGIAACLEEHFPHSMARAVVREAQKRGIDHEEKHSKVEYIVAHGISSMVNDSRVIIGSYHFVFEDEGCQIPEGMRQRFEELPEEYSHLYLAVEGRLAAVICIEDPLREEAADVIASLKKSGFQKVVMMTGDSERTARSVALKAGADEYYSEVLPEDKAAFVEKEKAEEKTVIMVGDGMNDSPALSVADAGIAISDGAQLAREIADITVDADHLSGLVDLKSISDRLAVRIQKNYFSIIGINSLLILLGAGGLIQPTVSAFVHNASTLAISLNSMKNLLD